MRIISQNGKIDFPYESFSLSITKDNCIVATRDTIASISEISVSVIAQYSTEEKAKKAMNMLHEKYMEVTIYPFSNKSSTIPPKVFRFPADDEIEV